MAERAEVFKFYDEISGGSYSEPVDTMKELFATANIEKVSKTRGNRTYIVNENHTPYNSVLFARWVMCYHKSFRKWFNLYDFSADQCHDLIYLVFRRVMHTFNTDVLNDENAEKILGQYVHMTITTACAEQARRARTYGSNLGDPKQKHRRINPNDCVDIDEAFYVEDDSQCPSSNDMMYDIKEKLKNNPYGEAVLNILLDSDKRGVMKTWEVRNAMNLTEAERKNPTTKKYILSAYKNIKKIVGKYRASIAYC